MNKFNFGDQSVLLIMISLLLFHIFELIQNLSKEIGRINSKDSVEGISIFIEIFQLFYYLLTSYERMHRKMYIIDDIHRDKNLFSCIVRKFYFSITNIICSIVC